MGGDSTLLLLVLVKLALTLSSKVGCEAGRLQAMTRLFSDCTLTAARYSDTYS